MRNFLTALFPLIVLGLVSAQDSCSAPTQPLCCNFFAPLNDPRFVALIGGTSFGPPGVFGEGCILAPASGACPSGKSLKHCAYFVPLVKYSAECYDTPISASA
ncbi:MAG: hypothetical protein J3R72DRAFT_222107 [Linnemannia gamsii]|nr:MAG: hypothetical protein J3R72DRAFT_222107 [Linnemannia gamsii]